MTRILIEIVLAIALIGAITVYLEHKGAARVEAADAKAEAAQKKQADAETALNVEKAAKADAGAQHDQQIVDDYRTAHPEQPVRLCHASSAVSKLPATGAANGGPTSTGAGPDTVSQVSTGSAGPDISPELDAIVRAAERVDILYAQRQHQ
jgi:hypothetical protein